MVHLDREPNTSAFCAIETPAAFPLDFFSPWVNEYQVALFLSSAWSVRPYSVLIRNAFKVRAINHIFRVSSRSNPAELATRNQR
jgi:hypothetical protein